VIGRVYRGGKVGGLLRYLYGPGRHNEHQDPHLVAAWDLESAAELATLEPEVRSGEGARAVREFRAMTGSMELATALRPGSVTNKMVWHCPLRVAPTDRSLTDSEWAQVARDVLHRTGIARRGDPGGCRWIAVRHDQESIHIVAVLARQDGLAARVSNDYRRVREACLAAEQRYGLVVTAPADRTAARHTTRAEVEKASRGGVVPARDWLREQVQYAAAGAREPAGFLDRLRTAGVVVRERRDPDGRLAGYAVGRREPAGETVLFGGGRLAADLSLPQLVARWQAAGSDQQVDVPAVAVESGERVALWEQASAAAAQATEQIRLAISGATGAAEGGGSGEAGAAADAAAAAAEVLAAASRLIEGDTDGLLTRAARDYDRAARERRGRPVPGSTGGSALRAAALRMAQGGRRPGRSEAAQVALLIAQIGRLSVSIARLREAQGRQVQATAARRAAFTIGQASGDWSHQARTAAAEAELGHRKPTTATRASMATTTPAGRRPPTGQEPRGRGR